MRRAGWAVATRQLVTGLVVAVTLALTALAAVQTTRLYATAPPERADAAVVADALPRLAFVRAALDEGAGQRMQALFPEGYFFTHALYGLTWVDVGTRDEAQRAEALTQARWALARLESDAGRAPFSAGLSPPYGVFYAGWVGWLRGGVLRLGGEDESTRFFAEAAALAEAFTDQLAAGGSPFLPAYPGQAWPVDSAVGLAVLSLADQLDGGEPAYARLRQRWWAAADPRRDPATGLLPHRVDAATGFPVEGARASSQALMLRFLREVDPAVAARDWVRFRDGFASTVPGVPGVREHPQGSPGGGDVDSGPLFLGLSASASVVALGTASVIGDRRSAAALAGLAEVTGAAVEYGGQRRYLGGRLPVGDAFLAWSLAADGWVVPAAEPGTVTGGPSPWWRLPWLLVMWWLIVPLWLLALVRLRQAAVMPTT